MDNLQDSEEISMKNELERKISSLTLAVTDEKGPPSDTDLPTEIKYQECFYNWLEGIKDSKCPVGLKNSKQKENGSDLKGGMKVAISESESKVFDCCHMIFHLTKIGNYDDADRDMNKLSQLLDVESNERNSVDSVQGYYYVVNNLKSYLLWKKGKSEELGAHLNMITIKNFAQLSVNGQVLVMRFKLMAFQHFWLNKQIVVAEKLTELEPRNPKWYYFMYYYYRDIRRQGALIAPPEKKETIAISKALEIEPDNVVYIVAGFQNLSERIRFFNPTDLTENPITWAGRKFSTIEQIVGYMKSETRCISLNSSTPVKFRLLLNDFDKLPAFCYAVLGEVFSSCLPPYLLDFVLAEKCVRAALDVSPNCTRSNHRMGIFLWKTNPRNFQSSVTYLRRAADLSLQNFHSRTDLIHLLLSKPEEQEAALHQCFADYVSEENILDWDNKELSELKFLKGCFFLMTSRPAAEIVKCWIEAYSLNPTANHFVSIYYQSKRFRWSSKAFNYARCKDVISQTLDKGGLNSEELEAITKISEGILEGLRRHSMGKEERNSNIKLRQSREKQLFSENDEFSWRPNKSHIPGDRLSFSEVDNVPLSAGSQSRYRTRPFQRNVPVSDADRDDNWRK